MSALLEAERVSFKIGTKALVREASLRLDEGRIVVVIGPNGAGKSTLLRLLSGELQPASGSVRYAGRRVAEMPSWQLACHRAILPQASQLAFPFTVREVARIGLDGIGRGIDRQSRARMVEDALMRADVAHLAERSYQSLSGGERQRTQFARILAQLAAGRSVADRQVLLLDEPVASLDLKHQLALLETAAGLARHGLAVLAVLHDLNLAALFANSIVVMQAGAIVAQGKPADVLDDELVSGVFEVALNVGAVPEQGIPFVLPRRREIDARRG